MNFKRIIPPLTLALLLSGCGNVSTDDSGASAAEASSVSEISASSDSSPSDNSPEKETTSSVESTVADPNAETKKELAEYTALFNTPEYNGFLTKSFSKPSEIDWDVVMTAGGGISDKNLTSEEIEDYRVLSNYSFFDKDKFIVIRRSDLEKFALKHTGEALNTDEHTLPWSYMYKYDSFYNFHWDYDDKTYTCFSIEKDGSDLTLRFQMDDNSHVGKSADRIVKATKTDDGLLIRSNEIQWKDGCDPDQSFDIDLADNGESLTFYTYKGYSGAARFILTKGGNVVSTGTLSGVRDDSSIYVKTLTAVGFFDFNADGIKDIVCIGDSDNGKNVILYESVDTNYNYEQCSADETVEKMIDGDLTLNKVKKALLGDNTEGIYNTYNEAYAQVAKLYNMSSSVYGYDYGLIDGNGDAIPELVINGASTTSLFTFENGHIHCLMQKWGWGAMGNHGYEYAPGKNVYFNDNSDYAGAIHYDSFMMPSEGQELQTYYSVKTNYFKDEDKDGIPSEDELAANSDMEYSESYYENHTGVEMTQEELETKVNELWNYDYKPLQGDADYEGLITVLQNS
ncbi:hypothetical protein bpr_I2817 [Butyrivibrio proteoclasticus B316]|uniref:FG-GAP repeat-containing protein n=1 Tax=Butyrivibrio proteoclasticus (strain ATCC 51982 / DSM 14932 / B316) TaxID=515622 RepID=E0RZY1_BUTPB|nr:hypothetical protein [Butyrivibrio proteoclasticus]ADL35547.1 hypothetical protein bpr_I2817 [Butyrivibrio proteoclasticus B316]